MNRLLFVVSSVTLRLHYATSQKVAGSSPDELDFFSIT
jgi:hypothetical protein